MDCVHNLNISYYTPKWSIDSRKRQIPLQKLWLNICSLLVESFEIHGAYQTNWFVLPYISPCTERAFTVRFDESVVTLRLSTDLFSNKFALIPMYLFDCYPLGFDLSILVKIFVLHSSILNSIKSCIELLFRVLHHRQYFLLS